jgi:hypothetical protein
VGLSSIAPPSGPRGYNPPTRGSYSSRGGRGGSFTAPVTERRDSAGSWGAAPPLRAAPVVSPTIPSPAPAASIIPTGPRGSNASSQWAPSGPSRSTSISSASSTYQRPQSFASAQPRTHPALANIPPIIPGGKIDPSASGLTKEAEERLRKLKEETDRARADFNMKTEKMRRSLKEWDKLTHESEQWRLKSELSERHMRILAGEGAGGAAF